MEPLLEDPNAPIWRQRESAGTNGLKDALKPGMGKLLTGIGENNK